MLLYPDAAVTLVLLQLTLAGPWTLASRLPPPPPSPRGCPSCRGSVGAARGPPHRQQAAETPASALLAPGEACGVYTRSCARGLRCSPPRGDASPLHALLRGRGVCGAGGGPGGPKPTETPQPAATDSTPSEDLEKAPCHRLLVSILKAVESQVFPSDSDIYMPNCDKRGFYRKKQCRSSRGMQRGDCWCVDESGARAPSRPDQQGGVHCDVV